MSGKGSAAVKRRARQSRIKIRRADRGMSGYLRRYHLDGYLPA
jgi:hypothetical protein